MINDMWQIETRSDDDWVFRMQSTSKEYLKTRGYEWIRLGFIREFRLSEKPYENTS